MNVPSGDQAGLDERSSTSRTGAPPSTGILNRRLPLPSSADAAIQRPSGDQDTVPRTSNDSASVRKSVPFELTTLSTPWPPFRTVKATRAPSAEMAGVATCPPSSARHSSTLVPSLYFHRPFSALLVDAYTK